MDYPSLQRANQIDDELKTARMVFEHLSGWDKDEDDPVKFVVNYLTECGNVGNSSTKKELAVSFINNSIKFLETKANALKEEFTAL